MLRSQPSYLIGTPLESVMLPLALHGQDAKASAAPDVEADADADADVDAGTASPRQSLGVIHAALT